MVKVAIAGGSGHVGLNIINAILAVGNHIPIILSRSETKATDPPNVEVRTVDYSNRANLVSSLQDVHTVIVTLFSADAKESVEHQLALLEAAKEAGVKRFAPSEWASRDNSGLLMYLPKLQVWEAVKNSGLEATRFVPGLFINMFAGGSNLPSEREALAGYPGNLFIDARAGIADIPGDGTTKITFTSVQDTAKFVAASFDLDKWEELSGIVGETKTFDEVVDVAERITGKTFLRTYLIKGGGERAERLLESLIYSESAKSMSAGHWEVEPTLNRRLPHLRALTVEEFLRRYWEGADWSTPAAAAS